METDQEASPAAVSLPAMSQPPVTTWLPSSRRGAAAARTFANTSSRFQGDGVRYKAKLIGVDPVLEAQGDKMCLDSMMKLKGLESAARSQGKHKQRVWIVISSGGLKIVDERTGTVEHEHESERISSLRKDESDPRALAYIYHHQDIYRLFYIKMANLADPVLDDIKEVCQNLDQVTQREPEQEHIENSTLLILDESPAPPPKDSGDVDLFNPLPSSSSEQLKQVSFKDELTDIFSISLEDPPVTKNSHAHQPGSQQQILSIPQILANYPGQPAGGSPYSSPTTLPWSQQGPLAHLPPNSNNQAPWPTLPGGMMPWAPAGPSVPQGAAHPPGYPVYDSGLPGCNVYDSGLPGYTMAPQAGSMWGQRNPNAVTHDRYPTAPVTGPSPTGSGRNANQSPSLI